MLASHAEELNNEDVVLLVENPEESCGEKDDVLIPRTLTLKRMSLAFSRTEAGLGRLAEDDPGHRHLTLSRRCYYGLRKEKQNKAVQNKYSFFLKRKESILDISQ